SATTVAHQLRLDELARHGIQVVAFQHVHLATVAPVDRFDPHAGVSRLPEHAENRPPRRAEDAYDPRLVGGIGAIAADPGQLGQDAVAGRRLAVARTAQRLRKYDDVECRILRIGLP